MLNPPTSRFSNFSASGQSSLSPLLKHTSVDFSKVPVSAQVRQFLGIHSSVFSGVTVVAGESGSGKTKWIEEQVRRWCR